MSETLRLIIDGKTCTCEKGEYLLEIAKRNGIKIPSLCYHEGLSGLGACRVCVVEVIERGYSKVVISCIYPVTSEIEVFTNNDKIQEMRGVILALLSRLAPNSKKIKKLASFNRVDLPRLKDKEGGDTCVLCGRCVTACEMLGTGAIAKVNRGVTKEIATPYQEPSVECIGCGSCAFICPTDSIASVQTEDSFTIWDKTFEMQRCSECGEAFCTRAKFEYLQSKQEEPLLSLCGECEKKAVARKVADASKVYPEVKE